MIRWPRASGTRAQTERIRLGTGVVPIYTRTPAAMAQEAATIDELSGGRFTLGLGVSHRPVVEAWHGQTIDKPLAEMREYLGIVQGDPARRGSVGRQEVVDAPAAVRLGHAT